MMGSLPEFLILIASLLVHTCHGEFTGKGTPAAIKEIVIGRCEDFKMGFVNPRVEEDMLIDRNCTELWELFYRTFAFREPCDVTMEEYDEFMSMAGHDYPMDTALFWDGWDIYDVVTEFAYRGSRKTVLDTTLPGYMANYMYFCGSTTDPTGMNMTVCPDEGECGFGVGSLDAFWASASTYFAEYARGDGRFFANSNRPGGAFHINDSYFTQFELKTITKEDVSFFDITLVTFLGEEPGDTCNSDSIQDLKRILDEKEIPYGCSENPSDVLHMQCIDDVSHDDCVGLYSSRGQPITPTVSATRLVLIYFVLLAVIGTR